MKALFDFDYLIECYVPAAKRHYGYFSLPILWDGKLVARMDCKVDKAKSLLNIHHIALEASLVTKPSRKEAFTVALLKELEAFLVFNQCEHYVVHKTSPDNYRSFIQPSNN